jgi:hypothetical protein
MIRIKSNLFLYPSKSMPVLTCPVYFSGQVAGEQAAGRMNPSLSGKLHSLARYFQKLPDKRASAPLQPNNGAASSLPGICPPKGGKNAPALGGARSPFAGGIGGEKNKTKK